ncbi:MAG: hypothetical protein L0J74_08300 [Corynebacterium sp.]|uniref:hypothetical protein n=1 Tax=Corynebacterium TaxID=1716 RepID=UPI0026471A08|nr:hypothetical protein [Corynebacterium sp.]MDN5724132.1 hypothetical protein [Corynebacterium sp.]MDN6282265.1 hypothetical protein [Corynebacterium sp.]MDN6305793.1 hypothetical protein [Corynebacterium sp.]MDN6352964.1 hypothetical protein [Corynebacterium sp.]MDN6367093.1 hypothetical protein [Corynebacterium sp.]
MNSAPRPALVPDDYPQLVAVWRSAVHVTHDFLTPAHRDAIEAALIPMIICDFPTVPLSVR